MRHSKSITLTDQQIRQLQALEHDKQVGERVRLRARFLRLSHVGTSVSDISALFKKSELTVLRTFDRWVAQGIQGLQDKPIPGRRGALGDNEKAFLRERLSGSKTWKAVTLANEVNKEFGLHINRETMRRCLHDMGYVWRGRGYIPADGDND